MEQSISSFLIVFKQKLSEVHSNSYILLDWVFDSTSDIEAKLWPLWGTLKASFIIPLLRLSIYICLIMSFLLSMELIHMMFLVALARLFRKKPRQKYKFESMKNDVENGDLDCPMVLIQIPIYNETAVYKISIGAACNLSWPVDRLVIQVLDDSTDVVVKDLIEKECIKWSSEGINIRYQYRETRRGYKAGALKEGLECDYAKQCEYVAIFDADFQPEPDFLQQAMPFLILNPKIGLVQARWTFVNADECFLTRMQEMSLDYQFALEHEGGSSVHAFFSFSGSGGIWRMATINEAGGWKDRTTVEDMDLAVRAGLKGWKFVYLRDLEVKNELPSTWNGYRTQQHRWYCGQANLFRKMSIEIIMNKEVSLWKKFYMVYNFFFVRRIITNMFVFLFNCIVLPSVSLFPEVDVPKKSGAFLATFIVATVNTAIATPRSIHLAIPWILFENVMSFHQTKALIMGLLESKRAHEWVVTEKLGDALLNKSDGDQSSNEPARRQRLRDRILVQELVIAVFLFACACYGVFYGADRYYIYLFLQAIFFTIAGFGYFGTIVSTPGP